MRITRRDIPGEMGRSRRGTAGHPSFLTRAAYPAPLESVTPISFFPFFCFFPSFFSFFSGFVLREIDYRIRARRKQRV